MRLCAMLLSLFWLTSATAEQPPHLLLISIDGYRHDYNALHQPPFLSQFEQEAALVKQLVPAYPSKTYPNHLTLITGLRPENHGIVSNAFYSPELDRDYSLSDRSAVTDGRFYQGMPLWGLAKQQGMRSASYFWPGSEGPIAGLQPDYWFPYQHTERFAKRIDQVVAWFSLPESERPQFVSLYFHQVDTAGHRFGPEAKQTGDALAKVDAAIAEIHERLSQLDYPINVVITGDHGMRDVTALERIRIDRILSQQPALAKRLRLMGTGPLTQIYLQGENKEADLAALEQLFADQAELEFYRREAIPLRLRFKGHTAIGDAIVLSNEAYLTTGPSLIRSRGDHGFEPAAVPQMHTLLMAQGPAFQSGARISQADNVHVYPLLADALGLTIHQPIDGDRQVLLPLLAK